MPRKILLISVMLPVLAFLFGCGGSSSDAPLSKKEYLQQVDAICAETLEEERSALAAATGSDLPARISKADQEELFTQEIFPQIESALEEVREIPPPAKDKAVVDEFIGDWEAGLAAVKKKPAQFARGEAFSRGTQGARIYGLSQCLF